MIHTLKKVTLKYSQPNSNKEYKTSRGMQF